MRNEDVRTSVIDYAQMILPVLQESTERLHVVDIIAKLGWEYSNHNQTKVSLGLAHLRRTCKAQGNKENGWEASVKREESTGQGFSFGEMGTLVWAHSTTSAPFAQTCIEVRLEQGPTWPKHAPVPPRWKGTLPLAQSTEEKVTALVRRGLQVVRDLTEKALQTPLPALHALPPVAPAVRPPVSKPRIPTYRQVDEEIDAVHVPKSKVDVLAALKVKPGTAAEIAAELGLSVPNAHNRLNLLAERGFALVEVDAATGLKVYAANPTPFKRAPTALERQRTEHWVQRRNMIIHTLWRDKAMTGREIQAACQKEGYPMANFVFYQALKMLREQGVVEGRGTRGPFYLSAGAKENAPPGVSGEGTAA